MIDLLFLVGKIGHAEVGQIPRELSRYMWYALDGGTIISRNYIR